MSKFWSVIGCIWFGLMLVQPAMGQKASLSGKVTWKANGNTSEQTEIILKYTPYKTQTDGEGKYSIKGIPTGTYTVIAFTLGIKSTEQEITLVEGKNTLNFELDSISEELEEFSVIAENATGFGLMHRRSIEGVDIFAGKKNEVVVLDQTPANMATNNSRQIFSRVAGLNIWESDRAGLQLDIGGRGLSPNRTSNFNTRQNGYDIAADALGYPESYYTPPSEAIEQIDVVRGAASLQYGTQFGGMINFKLRGPDPSKKFSLVSSQSIGSFGLFNSFNSVGGTVKNTGYYAFVNYKRGESWRPNSQFESFTGHAKIVQQFGKKLTLKAEYTGMQYLAQQPGGLTDDMFYDDPSQSVRARNWFRVNWNLMALIVEYRFSHKWRMEMRNFGLIASREALGILGFINRPDPGGPRDLLSDRYRNFGNETRVVHTYKFLGNSSNLLVGMRYYRGIQVENKAWVLMVPMPTSISTTLVIWSTAITPSPAKTYPSLPKTFSRFLPNGALLQDCASKTSSPKPMAITS
ncbi:carboxypeptidase-like regulatory domain-containing protein [bacterium SCSIO 12741]|nr:carboxypeptidase-like regulatory domain-containing protein [bacterium SCSIO 12741]